MFLSFVFGVVCRAGSVTALRTAFAMCGPTDEIIGVSLIVCSSSSSSSFLLYGQRNSDIGSIFVIVFHFQVFTAPKATSDSQREERMKEGLKMAAMIKNVQAVAKECQRANPKIEMAAVSVQPKIEVVKKVVADHIDLVVLGHGRYPSDAMGNVASYVVCFCSVLSVCVCLYGGPAGGVFILRVRTEGQKLRRILPKVWGS